MEAVPQHIVAIHESHEGSASHINVTCYRWFGHPRVGKRQGGVALIVANSLLLEVEICTVQCI